MPLRSLFILIVTLIVTGPGLVGASSVEANKQTVLDMTAAINERDLDALDMLVAPDLRRHCGATPDLEVESLDQFKAFLEADFAAVPDSVQTVNLMLGEGDLVAAHVTYAGTQSGQMGPFPPSGKRLEIPFIGILRIEDGKVAEIWVEWDNLNALMQLGHFEPPGGSPPDDAGHGE
jgi:predicted ester cyclase